MSTHDIPQKQKEWTREEMTLLVVEYFRTRPLNSEMNAKSVKMVSELLRRKAEANGVQIGDTYRNASGIKQQMACVSHFDPEEINKGHIGLTNGSKLLKEVTEEYLQNPERIISEAYLSIVHYLCD